MQLKNNENGFTLIEVIIAILIMTIGVLSLLSAITYAVMRERDSEKKNVARQMAAAAIESIFATRDLLQVDDSLRQTNGLTNWTAVANFNATTSPEGIFLTGYRPIRKDSGKDGIEGTADDACSIAASCVVGSYTNASSVISGYEREIIITNIYESGSTTVSNRRKLTVNVRYFAGQSQWVETVSTIISKPEYPD